MHTKEACLEQTLSILLLDGCTSPFDAAEANGRYDMPLSQLYRKLEIHSLLILTAEGLMLRCERLKNCYASSAFGWSAEQWDCAARLFTVGV